MYKVGMVLTFILIIIVAVIYSILSKYRNKAKKEYYNLDDYLKKKWEIVNDFVKILENYSLYEELSLEKLTVLTSEKYNTINITQKIETNYKISEIIKKIIKICEKNSDLSIDETYLALIKDLSILENNILKSIEKYNDFAKNYNKKIQIFPINIIAILFGFNEEKVIDE